MNKIIRKYFQSKNLPNCQKIKYFHAHWVTSFAVSRFEMLRLGPIEEDDLLKIYALDALTGLRCKIDKAIQEIQGERK